jgi:hypothetical protein
VGRSKGGCCKASASGSAAERNVSPRTSKRQNQLQLSLLPNRRICALAATMKSEVAASSRLTPRSNQSANHLAQEDGPSGRLSEGAASISQLVPRSRWFIPKHFVPTQTDSNTFDPQNHSPVEGIADLLVKLPTKACLEFTRSLLSTASSLPAVETPASCH